MVRKRIAVVSLPAVMLDWVQARIALGNQQFERNQEKKYVLPVRYLRVLFFSFHETG